MTKIVILGGGFGGVRCALDLEKKLKDNVQVTLVDRNSYHLFLPSLYEGFGYPILEAYAARIPVVSSTAGPLPEVAGKGALLFDPPDVAALTAHLTTLATDKRTRERLIRAGDKELTRFNPRHSTEKLWRALIEAAQ